MPRRNDGGDGDRAVLIGGPANLFENVAHGYSLGAVSVPALSEWLAGLERQLDQGPVPEHWTLLAWVAGREVPHDEDELREALRRAMLLLAAGGDPHRELVPDGRAVTALAADLDRPERREALMRGVDELAGLTDRLPRVRAALFDLAAAPDSAWRAYACGILAAELAEEDED